MTTQKYAQGDELNMQANEASQPLDEGDDFDVDIRVNIRPDDAAERCQESATNVSCVITACVCIYNY